MIQNTAFIKIFIEEFSESKSLQATEKLEIEQVVKLIEDPCFTPLTPLICEFQARKGQDSIRVTGKIVGGFEFECGRCLTLRRIDLNDDFEVVYVHKKTWENLANDQEEFTEETYDVDFYEGREIELDRSIRETILLAFPPFGLCQPEFKTQCDAALEALISEANLDRMEIARLEASVKDQRWGALQQLQEKMFGSNSESE